jgi:hypothetical protein
MNGPSSVCSDGTRIFVADTNNSRVLVFQDINSLISNYNPPTGVPPSADAVLGQPDFNSGLQNAGGNAINGSFSYPTGLCFYNGRLFIADYFNNRIVVYDALPSTPPPYYWRSANLVMGQGSWTSGGINRGNGPGSPANNSLYYPVNIWGSTLGLFVADSMNNRVLLFSPVPTNNDPSAVIVIGQSSMTSNAPNQGGTIAANTLKNPGGVITDGNRLAISDGGNNRVLIYNSIPDAYNASADIVLGQNSFSTGTANQPSSVPRAFNLNGPLGISGSTTGLFVCDGLNHRVLRFPDSTNTPTFTPVLTPSPTPLPVLEIGKDDIIAYPIPAQGNTLWFIYTTTGVTEITINIYNVIGEKVKTITALDVTAGTQRVQWDLSRVAPGIYFYKIKKVNIDNSIHESKLNKVVIIK